MKRKGILSLQGPFVSAAIMFLAGSAYSSAQEASSALPETQISNVSTRILQNAEKANCRPNSCKILVADFSLPSGLTSQFGLQLADQLSKELASRQNGIQTIDRSTLKSYLERERISPDLLKSDRAMRWLGKELNATAVLTGITQAQELSVKVQLKLLSCGKDKQAPAEEITLPLPEAKDALRGFDLVANAVTKDRWASAPAAYSAGAGIFPVCLYCPPPPYSEAARVAKFEGQVVLDVVVSEEGQVKWTRIVRGAPFGLNQEAVNTVRQWKFRPGVHDGKPVSVFLPLDLGFRLLDGVRY